MIALKDDNDAEEIIVYNNLCRNAEQVHPLYWTSWKVLQEKASVKETTARRK